MERPREIALLDVGSLSRRRQVEEVDFFSERPNRPIPVTKTEGDGGRYDDEPGGIDIGLNLSTGSLRVDAQGGEGSNNHNHTLQLIDMKHELERLNEDNRRLRSTLDQATKSYSALHSHLLLLRQQQAHEIPEFSQPSFRSFSQEEIQYATNSFSQSLVIGEGGYGKVYKCQLDNREVAVKILHVQSNQGLREYFNEVEFLQTTTHENLVHLMGSCIAFYALVYEYVPNGSLEDCLRNRPQELTWEIRTRIVYEICTALRFLRGQKPPLVHGDLKPHNVLLGANFKVKLADFGFGRYLTEGENSEAFHQTLNISGSVGYVDPDYLGSGKVTPGVDVYSLGKTVVRILTGQHPPDVFWEVRAAKKGGSFMSIVDPTVRDWPEDVVDTLARFALRATKPERDRSKFMGSFYSELEKILDGIHN